MYNFQLFSKPGRTSVDHRARYQTSLMYNQFSYNQTQLQKITKLRGKAELGINCE